VRAHAYGKSVKDAEGVAWVALVRKTIILAYAMLRCGQALWDVLRSRIS